MSVSLDGVTKVFDAIPIANKEILTRTTPDKFPFVNLEVGTEQSALQGATDTRTVSIVVSVHVINSNHKSLFLLCDNVENSLKTVQGLKFFGYSKVKASFENEYNFFIREMNYSFTSVIC